MKHCTNCGYSLPPNVTSCPQCGAATPHNAATPNDPNASTVSDSNQGNFAAINNTERTIKAEPSPSSSENYGAKQEQMYGPMPQPQPPQQQPLYIRPASPTPQPPPYQGTPLYGSQPQQSSPYQGMPLPHSQPQQPPPYQGMPLPSTRKSGISKGMAILLVVLALLIMAGGSGLIYYTTVTRPAQLNAQATATVQTIQTTDANSTAAANTHATGTAQSIANTQATGTAQAFVTATANTQATAAANQATATALQNIYTQATSGSPALNASLSGQDDSNWDVGDTPDGGGCGFASNAYHVTVQSQNHYLPCFGQNTNFSNFAFEVQMTINEGDSGGLLFRADSDRNSGKFYAFSIDTQGKYAFDVSKDATHSTALASDSSSAIKAQTGSQNTLTVVARNGNFYLYINKQFVDAVSDGTFSSGVIGFFASESNSNTDVSFSNARVWKL